MKDNLKDFVTEHREQFDVFEPRPELWQQICRQLPPPSKEQEAKIIHISFGERARFSADFLFMRVAAAILLLLGCGLTLLLMKQNPPTTGANTLAVAAQPAAIAKIAPELAEAEIYYAGQIQQKKEQLSAYDLKVLGLDDTGEIDRELARLDSSYLQLKKQLLTTPNTSRVIDAMIQNLWIRTQVLNRQLDVLRKIDQLQKQETTNPETDETNV